MTEATFKPKVRAVFDLIKSLMISEGLYYIDFKSIVYIDQKLGPVATLTLKYNVLGDPVAKQEIETTPPVLQSGS